MGIRQSQAKQQPPTDNNTQQTTKTTKTTNTTGRAQQAQQAQQRQQRQQTQHNHQKTTTRKTEEQKKNKTTRQGVDTTNFPIYRKQKPKHTKTQTRRRYTFCKLPKIEEQ